MLKLNIGCGDVHLDGWVNIDLDSPKADLKHDVRTPLPYADNTVDIIYNEHFIEHLSVQEGISFLKECYRVLRQNGVLRIATPDLDYLMFRYFFFWKKQNWLKKYGYDWIKTKAEMINLCFHEWGHKYLYNKEELKRRLQEAGFNRIHKRSYKKSKHQELKDKETRSESKLIFEAIK